MRPVFLHESALLLKPDKILVVADLHLDIEYEIYQSGISIPNQIEKIRKRIDALLLTHNIKHLIFLGDIKHNIPVASYQEIKEMPNFLEHFSKNRKQFVGQTAKHFSKKVKVSIVKGNHDGDIERFAPKEIKIFDGSGFAIKNFGFAHGQAWPAANLLNCKYLVIGHEHPAVQFQDSLGFRSIEHCWLKCKISKAFLEKKYKTKCNLQEVIIMPAFSHIVGGMAFNKKDFEPLGPLFKGLRWKESDVHLTDGTYLGSLKNLMK